MTVNQMSRLSTPSSGSVSAFEARDWVTNSTESTTEKTSNSGGETTPGIWRTGSPQAEDIDEVSEAQRELWRRWFLGMVFLNS